MSDYSEPDAYARQGIGVALISSSLTIVLFALLPFAFRPFIVAVAMFLLGIGTLWIGVWEANQIISEESGRK